MKSLAVSLLIFSGVLYSAKGGTRCWTGTQTGQGQYFIEANFRKKSGCCPRRNACVRIWDKEKKTLRLGCAWQYDTNVFVDMKSMGLPKLTPMHWNKIGFPNKCYTGLAFDESDRQKRKYTKREMTVCYCEEDYCNSIDPRPKPSPTPSPKPIRNSEDSEGNSGSQPVTDCVVIIAIVSLLLLR